MTSKQHNDIDEFEEVQAGDAGPAPAPEEAARTGQCGTESAAGPETEEADSWQQQFDYLEKQVQENLDRAIRAQAELDNVRKRSLRDVENAHKYALEKFAGELLPVLDSMEMGLRAAESADEHTTIVEGMRLTLKMFRDLLEKFGIREVEIEGEKFDPEKHEAVSMQESEDNEPGTVVSVLQKGYFLNDRLIRPATVIVAK